MQRGNQYSLLRLFGGLSFCSSTGLRAACHRQITKRGSSSCGISGDASDYWQALAKQTTLAPDGLVPDVLAQHGEVVPEVEAVLLLGGVNSTAGYFLD